MWLNVSSLRRLKNFQIYENKHVLRENKLLYTSFHFALHGSNKFMCKQKEGIIIYTMHIHLRCLTRYRRARRRHKQVYIWPTYERARHEWIVRMGRADILMITAMTRIYNVSYNVTYKLGCFSFYVLFSLLV